VLDFHKIMLSAKPKYAASQNIHHVAATCLLCSSTQKNLPLHSPFQIQLIL
jgi:hypothetical protein